MIPIRMKCPIHNFCLKRTGLIEQLSLKQVNNTYIYTCDNCCDNYFKYNDTYTGWRSAHSVYLAEEGMSILKENLSFGIYYRNACIQIKMYDIKKQLSQPLGSHQSDYKTIYISYKDKTPQLMNLEKLLKIFNKLTLFKGSYKETFEQYGWY
jgi:hypothetical protein